MRKRRRSDRDQRFRAFPTMEQSALKECECPDTRAVLLALMRLCSFPNVRKRSKEEKVTLGSRLEHLQMILIRKEVPLGCSRLRIGHCHCWGCCCGAGSVPGPGSSTCRGCSWGRGVKLTTPPKKRGLLVSAETRSRTIHSWKLERRLVAKIISSRLELGKWLF